MNRGLSILAATNFLLAIVTFLARIVNGYSIGNEMLNSDLLLFPAIFRDVFVSKIPFYWKFSSQLFIFPEFLEYFLLNVIFKDFITAIYVNGLINILITFMLVYLIYKVTKVKKYQLIWLSLSLVLLLASIEDAQPIIGWIYTTVGYYGAFMCALVSIAYTGYILFTKVNLSTKFYMLAVGYIIGIFLTTISDPLYLVMFYFPMIAFLFFAYVLNYVSNKKLIYLFLINTLTVVLALYLRRIFSQFIAADINTYISFQNIGITFISLAHQAKEMLKIIQGFELMVIGLLILVSSMYLFYLIKSNSKDLKSIFFAFLASIFPLLNILVIIIMGQPTVRYLLAAFILPIIFLPLALRKYIKTRTIVVISILLFTASIIIFIKVKPNNVISNTKALTTCIQNVLDKEHVNEGIGGYWDSRSIQLFLHNIQIAQVKEGFKPYYWLNNGYEYANLKPQFVIIRPALIKQENIDPISYFGRADSFYMCDYENIYIYKNNANLQGLFKGFIASYNNK